MLLPRTRNLLLPILTLFTLFSRSLAWGSLAHRTTTLVALLHLPPNHQAHNLLTTLLNSQDPATASLFPDRIRYIPSFAYTAPWHYIDSHTTPPNSCGLNLTLDCPSPSGCVISAIANHTSRVADTTLPLWQRGQSLRFMLHFFGDVHMPLHTVGWERGGNELPVMFDGVKSNLHSVWDTLISRKIVALAGEGVSVAVDAGSSVDMLPFDTGIRSWDPTNETSASTAWASFLYSRYRNDPAQAEDTSDLTVCTHDAAECALSWAGEANAWVCRYILRDGVDGVQDQDLGGEYFEGAVPIVEGLVFKGGRRLAKWLEVVAEAAEWEEKGEL